MTQTITMKNSLRELLDQAGPGMTLFLPDSLLAFIPEDKQTIPMEEWADSFLMPWGLPFPAADFVEDANMLLNSDRYWDMIPLWDQEHFCICSNDIHSVSLMVPKCALEGVRPAALICPGGGYENISFHSEGLLTAKRLEKAGYRTFILNYRYSPNRWPAPQLDLALAIRYLRANAAELCINPDDLMILGYSAGGHLCASTAALRDELADILEKELEEKRPDLAESLQGISIRPDKVCLCYPVISFLKEDHEPSFQALTGGDESLREHLSIEKQVDPDYPKTFVWTCADDSLVPPSNASRMDAALTEQKVPHKFCLYPQGEHGCSLGTGTSAEGWMDEMLQFFS
jgi:acetyl esterase/lipase